LTESVDFGKYTSLNGVRANFIVDEAGNYEVSGSSRGLGNDTDRELLIHLRSLADAVIVGGNTARIEKYRPTARFQTYVFSKNAHGIEPDLNILAFDSAKDLSKIFDELRARHPRLLVEAGPSLVSQLLEIGVIDELCLTVTGTQAVPADLVLKLFGVQLGAPTDIQIVNDMQFVRWNL
jgi:riboflavin biosynthesis pyrimidine reductase